MQGHRQHEYGGIPWMCAWLYHDLVPHQGVRHFTIYHSHPYTNKARSTYVMLARPTSLACTQSPKPLSDAQVHSKVEVLTFNG